MRRRLVPVIAALALAACAGQAPTTPRVKASPKASLKPGAAASLSPDGQTIAAGSGNIIGNNGSSAITPVDGLRGRVTAPATLIGNNGAGIIGNNGGSIIGNNGAGIISNGGGNYRLLATDEVAVAGAEVVLVRADGQTVKDAEGRVVSTKTDADGKYVLPFAGATQHLLARVTLPEAKGDLLAFVPRNKSVGGFTVDLSLRSTLVMGYVLGQYVKGDPLILEKLPEDVEVETRTKMATALAGGQSAVPPALTFEAIAETVDALRKSDKTIDDQLEKVKRILLVGLSDQGAGKDALSVETDASTLAVSPAGEVFYGGILTSRVWHRDAAGLLRAYAGNGLRASTAQIEAAAPGQPAPGDGGPATEAVVSPFAIDFDTSGNLYIADAYFKRVRKVDTAGVITTLAAHAEWDTLGGLVVGPEGVVYVSTKTAVYKIAADKTVSKVAGGEPGTPANGTVEALRFSGISDLTLDPVKGYLYALDASRVIVEIRPTEVILLGGAFSGVGGIEFQPDGSLMMADAINRKIFHLKDWVKRTLAGSGAFGLVGDGGAATSAAMCGPRNLAVGPDGAVYTVDAGFIRRIKDGTITTVIGKTTDSGATPADQAQLRGPRGLTYDAASHSLLIAELWRVRKWDLATNQITTHASSGLTGAAFQEGGGPTASSLFNFAGLALGPTSALTFLADDASLKRRLVRLKDGKLTTLAGTGADVTAQGLLAQLGQPALEAAVPVGTLPVAVKGENAYYALHLAGPPPTVVVVQVTPGGTITELCRVGSDFQAFGLAVTPDGASLLLGVANAVHRYDFGTGQVSPLAVTTLAEVGTLTEIGLPSGFAFDAAGACYFADYATGRVQRLSLATGALTAVAGKGTPLLAGSRVDDSLTSPWGVAIDRDGNLYISDSGANQIKKIPAAQLPR